MNEAFLQYVWQHRLLEGPLTTADGSSVIVENPGELNRDAGPDFFNARIKIGDICWAGNVEVHVRASDWKQHHHTGDKKYNNVILHVVYLHDTDIIFPDGKKIPTLEISSAIPDHVWQRYDELMNPKEDVKIPCAPHLSKIPDFLFQISQDRLVVERMERKSDDVYRILRESKGNWEQAFYLLMAHYFGGNANAFPFELMAKLTPLSIIAQIKDMPYKVESLFFGQSGLLEGEFSDDFPKGMQRQYEILRWTYNLTPMDGHIWKFFRVTPSSFPTLRISQFANLIAKSSNLFSKLLETTDIKQLLSFFDVQASEYWNGHYNFDKVASTRVKTLGTDKVNSLLINAWIPLLLEYGVMRDDQRYKERAFEILKQLPPEDNNIVRLWRLQGVKPRNAAESQALIQRYNEYCCQRKCLDCQLAFRIIKDKS